MIFLLRLKFEISTLYFRVRMLLQRIFKGYSNDQIWNLDHAIVDFILPKLKLYKELYGKNSIPSFFYSKNGDASTRKFSDNDEKFDSECIEKWNIILDSMIKAFELIKDDYECCYVNDKFCEELYEKNEKIIKEGLDNFAKYFRNLWD